MSIFADVADPGGLLSWLVVGVIAGLLAGRVTRGSAYGLIGDVVVGLAGAVVGGLLFGQFVPATAGFAGSLLAAFAGACLLISVTWSVAPVRFCL